MSLTMIVTRDVEARYRGFLTSIMLEVSPGVYVSPRLNKGVRDRVWTVLSDWHMTLGRGSVTMVVRNRAAVGEMEIKTLGTPPKTVVDADGVLLVKR